MAAPFMTPSHTVLLVGDEALYVYKVTHNAVKLVDGVPWGTDDFEESVVGLIRKECDGRPVLILNDMTDQHFKGGQRLPKVGLMDKGHVLQRKLQVAFPNYPIRGAMPVKGGDKKLPKGDGKVKGMGGLYLFAAVPGSEQIVKTLESVKLSMASIAGFTLLPIESSDMVRAMSEKLSGKGKKASRWVVFMGQHQSGSLRQVITRDGQLAMTRMTPVSDAAADPQAWAHEVSQEFKATVGYLSRFGYSADEGTEVIVIAGQKAGELVGNLIDTPCNFSAMTASEAARLLGMKIGVQEDGNFAEPLHVAWAGRKSKFILPMEAGDIHRIQKPRQAVAAVMFLLLLGVGYLGWQLMSQAQAMVSTRSDLGAQRSLLAQAEDEYQQEVRRMEALGFDIRLIQSAIDAYSDFETDRIPVLPVVSKIGEALGDDMHIDRLSIDQVDSKPVTSATGEQKPGRAMLEAKLELSFPQTVEIEIGMKAINDLERRLRNALPEYDVAVTKQIGRPVYTAQLKGETGPAAREVTAAEDYEAQLVIRGPKR